MDALETLDLDATPHPSDGFLASAAFALLLAADHSSLHCAAPGQLVFVGRDHMLILTCPTHHDVANCADTQPKLDPSTGGQPTCES